MYLAISSLWSRKSLWDVKKCDKMIQKNKLAAHLHPDNDDTIAPSPTSDASHAIPNGRGFIEMSKLDNFRHNILQSLKQLLLGFTPMVFLFL